MSSLAKKLKASGVQEPEKRKIVWKGPLEDGVTQSLLGRYLTCKERFRLQVIEGLTTATHFSARLEYGNLWHACEEGLAKKADWQLNLREAARAMVKKYPLAGSEIEKWYKVCLTQFPIYVKWWSKHKDVTTRTPLFQEEVFKIPYTLNDRTVLLRGKFDSVDLIGKTENVYLQENKTKGDIEPALMQRQLSFDCQTMFYLIALENLLPNKRIAGVRYNVIRRPLSGGKGSIRQHQPSKSNPEGESEESFYSRLGTIIEEAIEDDGSHYFFMRWKVDTTSHDIEKFKRECLNPVLENLCDDYEWWRYCFESGESVYDYELRQKSYPLHRSRHYRLPYGIYNPIAEGTPTDLDEYLASGSETGLQRVTNLFPELE